MGLNARFLLFFVDFVDFCPKTPQNGISSTVYLRHEPSVFVGSTANTPLGEVFENVVKVAAIVHIEAVEYGE